MAERLLASVQEVVKISPIEGADRIEVATVLGWECVVPKGQFKEGDLVVYFEIDSLIPYTEWSKFLWKDKAVINQEEARHRLKTMKLRGHISQGLVQPLSIIPNKVANGFRMTYCVKVGDDVTKILNVIKYEPDMPANLRGNIKSRKVNWLRGKLYKYFPFFFKHRPTSTTFPPFLQKTDETRVQSIPKIFDEIRGMDVYITEKLDGTSVTYYLNGKEFGVCSRNFELQESKDNTYWQIAKEYDIKNKLKEYLKTTNYKGIAIQGEIIGEGIQKNPLGIKGKKLFIFNLYHINTKSYASFDELKDFGKIMEIPMVPILEHRARVDMFWDVSKLIEMAKGNSVLNPKVKREGIVVRTMLDTYSHVMKGRMSFKAINNDYLLSGGE